MSAAVEIASSLSSFTGRGVGTDAERRAAGWLAEEIRRDGRRSVELQPFWCRPNWAMAQAWHTALGVAGSLASVGSPKVGAALVVVALLCTMADATFAVSPGRRLTPEHASQNVVSVSSSGEQQSSGPRLLLTANLDAGRQGLVYRPGLRRVAAQLRSMTGGRAPGWAGWLTLALTWVLVTTLLRVEGLHGGLVGAAQVVPTVALVISLALLLELAGSAWAPAAGDNGAGVAVAVALTRALDVAPPGQAAVDLVLTGAGDGQAIGLRRHLRLRRHSIPAKNTIVLGIAACGGGRPVYLRSDGPLLPLGYFRVLRHLCRSVAVQDPGLGLRETRGRGESPALAARQAGLPAITLAALDADGLAPRSHRPDDVGEELDPASLDGVLRTALLLVDAVDAYLGGEDEAPAESVTAPSGQAAAPGP